MSRDPRPITPDEVTSVLVFIARQQAHPERAIAYLGTDIEAIREELEALEPPWTDTVRVVVRAGEVLGASLVEVDEELGRAWIHGPWVAGDALAWEADAGPLLDAAIAQLPAGVDRLELFGDVANALLADLADQRGWQPTGVVHALVADAATVAAWPEPEPDGARPTRVRPATPADLAAVTALHHQAFPDTHTSAEQLLAGAADGSRTVLVAGEPVVAYAAGQVHPDGEGFIDYVAVTPAAGGRGLGAELVTAVARRCLERSTTGRVSLTVDDHRTRARALYAGLGFRPDASMVAYRNW